MDFRFLGKWGYAAEGAALVVLSLFSFYTALVNPTGVSGHPSNSAASHLVSYLTIGAATVPEVFVGLAWFGAGRSRRSTLLKVTGILGLLTGLGGSAFAVWLNLGFLPTGSSPTTTSLVLTSAGSTLQAPGPQVFGAFLTFLLLGFAVGIVALCYLIMEILSFFSANSLFAVQYFRYAGWGRILAIIAIGVVLLVVFVEALFASLALITTANQPSEQMIAKVFNVAFGTTFLIWAVPDIIAAFAFGAITQPGAPLDVPGGLVSEGSPARA